MEQGVKVAIANRGSNGSIAVADGNYYDLRADSLTPQKALILMILGLTVTDDSEELRRIFLEYREAGRGGDSPPRFYRWRILRGEKQRTTWSGTG